MEEVTPNEIARSLGVAGLQFRNWLRAQKGAGHPIVAGHEYRSRYRFTRAEADQLATEFQSGTAPTTASRGTSPRRSDPPQRAARPAPDTAADDQRERWLMARVAHFAPSRSAMTETELVDLTACCWWTMQEMETTRDELVPRDLPALLCALLTDGPPSAPIEVGI